MKPFPLLPAAGLQQMLRTSGPLFHDALPVAEAVGKSQLDPVHRVQAFQVLRRQLKFQTGQVVPGLELHPLQSGSTTVGSLPPRR